MCITSTRRRIVIIKNFTILMNTKKTSNPPPSLLDLAFFMIHKVLYFSQSDMMENLELKSVVFSLILMFLH